MLTIKNKIAIIFGVRNDSSIAWHVVQTLLTQGCKVALSYTADTKLEVEALLARENLTNIVTAEVDIRNETQIAIFVKTVFEVHGKIDFVLHGVAYGNHRVMCSLPVGSKGEEPSFLDIPYEDFMESFDISAYSLIRVCRVALPYLSKKASIVTLTYNASQRVFPTYAGMSINKAALENLTKYLAFHLRGQQIRVNAVSAGLVMTTSSGGIKGVRTLRKIGKKTAPLGNITAQDVANTVLYYFSPMSERVTGNIHYVDGGFNIMGVNLDEN